MTKCNIKLDKNNFLGIIQLLKKLVIEKYIFKELTGSFK